MTAYHDHNSPILLPGANVLPGYEVWQVEGSPSKDGPWTPVNAGQAGTPLRARFARDHKFWRVLWTAYTGAVSVTAAAPLPGGVVPGRGGPTRIRLTR